MPNKKGGKGFKKGGKKFEAESKFLPTKQRDQEYGRVTTMFGNSRIDVYCNDDEVRRARMQKSLKREKMFIAIGDIVLLNIQKYQDTKGYVAYRYTPQEAKRLLKDNEITLKTFNPEMENIEDDIFDREPHSDDEHDSKDDNGHVEKEKSPQKEIDLDDIWDSL